MGLVSWPLRPRACCAQLNAVLNLKRFTVHRFLKELISMRERTDRTGNGQASTAPATSWKILSRHIGQAGTGGRTRGRVKLRIEITSEKTSGSRRRLLKMSVGEWRAQPS